MKAAFSFLMTLVCFTIGSSQEIDVYARTDYSIGIHQKVDGYSNEEPTDLIMKVNLLISNTKIKLFPLTIPGELVASESSIKFYPKREFNTVWGKFAYPDNYLIRDIELDYSNIKKVRRNWFYILPNMIIIKTNDGKSLRLNSYNRRLVIEQIRKNI